MKAVEEKFKEFLEKVEEAKVEMEKFQKGNKSAATRFRGAMMDCKNLCTPIRDAVQAEKLKM